ncbi:MAG: hypothetical protein QOE96_4190 [Blastocatellia bacterium]|jgi:hypothetical protein|nr:hypothetical protein [Blastocatellia bacterium]
MSDDHYEQVDLAYKTLEGIRPNLWDSPIILSSPERRIFHDLKFPEQTERDKQAEQELLTWYQSHGSAHPIGDWVKASAAKNRLRWGFPYYAKLGDQGWEAPLLNGNDPDWVDSPHHDLTMRMLRNNIVPHNIGDGCPGEPVPLTVAMSHARARGHEIPDSFFKVRPISHAEKNGFCAARDLLYRQRGLARTVRALASKYAIPNPEYPNLSPYFVDQLWVVLEYGPRVRLVIVEIDNEGQLAPDQQTKARRRDEVLGRLGYEVYHVAGWWCRVDSWRVISELLAATGINPDATDQISCGHTSSIAEYRCAKCHGPVIRWDNHWISEGEEGEFLHESCYYDYY